MNRVTEFPGGAIIRFEPPIDNRTGWSRKARRSFQVCTIKCSSTPALPSSQCVMTIQTSCPSGLELPWQLTVAYMPHAGVQAARPKISAAWIAAKRILSNSASSDGSRSRKRPKLWAPLREPLSPTNGRRRKRGSTGNSPRVNQLTPERWRQVKAIFHEAAETPAADLSGLLDERCGADAELRTEVESLLASAANAATGLLSTPVFPSAVARAHPADPMIGRKIGNYVISAELARGGMGVVYRGRHTSLPRDVVIKCIRPLGAGEPARADLEARFLREAHIQCQLDHPNIVRVYEFFTEPDGCFLVMEYVDGSSVRALLDKEGPLPAEQVTRLAVQALAGLEHAHTFSYTDESGHAGAGVVHRDIKPGNLILDQRGNLKLTDFGIAKLSGQRGLTKTGLSPGTVDYMSPEQIRGLSVDARSDLYSLGATLYEMLTGHAPYSDGASISDYDRLKARVETDAPPIQSLNPAIPAVVAGAVMRALERDPARRWQSAREFRQALSGEIPAAPARLARTSWPRRAWLLAAAAVVLLAVTAGLWRWRERTRAARPATQSVAVLPFADLSGNKEFAYLSDGISEEILNALTRVSGLRVAGQASVLSLRKSNTGIREIGKALNVSTVLEGSVRSQGDRARIAVQLTKVEDGFQIWSETYEVPLSDIPSVEQNIAQNVVSAIQGRLLGGGNAVSTSSRRTNPEAYRACLQGRHLQLQGSEESVEKATAYFEQAIQLDPEYAPAWAGLAECRSMQSGWGLLNDKYAGARSAAQRALALDPTFADAHAMIGAIQMLQDWDWAGADASYRQALKLKPGDPGVLRGMGSLARIMGRLDEGIRLYRQAIEADPVAGHRSFGLILYYAGRYDEAAAAMEKSLELSPDANLTHALLAQVYLAQSRPQEAIEEAAREKVDGLRRAALSMAYFAAGRRKESDAQLSELIRKNSRNAPVQIAQVYAFRGETDRAFQWLDRTYAAHEDSGIGELKSDPILKRLQGDPRYRAMLMKLGLPL